MRNRSLVCASVGERDGELELRVSLSSARGCVIIGDHSEAGGRSKSMPVIMTQIMNAIAVSKSTGRNEWETRRERETRDGRRRERGECIISPSDAVSTVHTETMAQEPRKRTVNGSSSGSGGKQVIASASIFLRII